MYTDAHTQRCREKEELGEVCFTIRLGFRVFKIKKNNIVIEFRIKKMEEE